MSIPSSLLYQAPSETGLKLHYVGRRIEEVDGPAAVIDVAVVRRNCEAMLKTAERLGVQFRAHVKTHKTTQLTRLQVGEAGPVRLVVSTIAEIEQLVPYLSECSSRGRTIDLIYGVPPTPSSLQRLASLATLLNKGSAGHGISLLIDHPDTVEFLRETRHQWPWATINVFIKVDTGYHRAGVLPSSPQLISLLRAVHQGSPDPAIQLKGFYSHASHSYAGSSPTDALKTLLQEISGVADAADTATSAGSNPYPSSHPLTLSVGASPTCTAAQNLLLSDTREGQAFHALHRSIRQSGHVLELHAGVYPLLDLQQVATHARPACVPGGADADGVAPLSTHDVGLRILVEVASLYAQREKPEALVHAGTLALGREPCKSYPGWGVVTGWRDGRGGADGEDGNAASEGAVYGEERRTGWIVGRISQEHGILTWEGPREEVRELRIGEKLMVWPNHACIASAGYGWYLVVDGESGDPDVVRDVWVRWRGW